MPEPIERQVPQATWKRVLVGTREIELGHRPVITKLLQQAHELANHEASIFQNCDQAECKEVLAYLEATANQSREVLAEVEDLLRQAARYGFATLA